MHYRSTFIKPPPSIDATAAEDKSYFAKNPSETILEREPTEAELNAFPGIVHVRVEKDGERGFLTLRFCEKK